MEVKGWERVRFLLEAEALPAVHRLADTGAPDRRPEAHAVASLLRAVEAAGVPVTGSYEALTDALETGRADHVRVILSVTCEEPLRGVPPDSGPGA